jgi:hypothetical protein
MDKPKEPPPKEPDSLERLADFTKRILRVPKEEMQDKRASTGQKTGRERRVET